MKNKIIVLVLLLMPIIFWAKFVNAATLYFTPSSGNIAVGDIFTANVYVNTKNAAINNAEAVINFPSNLLEIVSISKSGSVFSLWVEEPTFSNSAGTLSFNGGVPTPGFNGTAGKAFGAVFRVKKAGSASLIFSSAAVRANDGLGTDILDSQGSAKFILSAGAVLAPEEVTAPSSLPSKPFIKHQIKNQNGEIILVGDSEAPEKWVNSSFNKFVWQFPSGVTGVSVLLHEKPSVNPGSKSDGFFDNKVYERLDDRIYYFHIRYQNDLGAGPILHYKFMVDTTPPEPFEIILPDGKVTANPMPRIRFETFDKLSGIDRYEIKIDDGDWFNAATLKTASYILPKLKPGEHQIFIRAYDKAGNYAEAKEIITVSPIASPKITEYPNNIISPGEKLVIKGESLPKATIEIHLNKLGKEPIVFNAQANETGNWESVYENIIPSGAYEVWAKQILDTGAESLQSQSVYIGVNSWFWRAWQWLKNVGGIIVLVLIFLAILTTAIYYSWHHFKLWRIKLKKEIHEAESAVSSGFKKLKKEIKSGKTSSKVLKDLSEIEKNIEKEIKDIEK